MSMILTAYNVIKPLPPEGSEEWLAMLPGWSGWLCRLKADSDYSYYWLGRYEYFHDYDVLYFNTYEGMLGTVNPTTAPFVGDIMYTYIGGYYYFRGAFYKKGDGFPSNKNMNIYYIARATSLTPQR